MERYFQVFICLILLFVIGFSDAKIAFSLNSASLVCGFVAILITFVSPICGCFAHSHENFKAMKKRQFLFFAVLCLLVMGQTFAQQLSPNQAKAKAEAFLSKKTGLRAAGDLQLLFAVTDTTQLDAGTTLRVATGSDNALLYAFGCETGGYVIAAGDERAEAILGYSTEGTLQADNLPEGLRSFLRQYAVEIAKAQEQDLRSDEKKTSYNPLWKAIDPLVTAKWSQEEPYNRQTPAMDGQQCLTGCPAVVMAQLVDYYQYQNWKVAEETWFSGVDDGSQYVDREVTVQFTDTVNWSLLKRDYTAGTYTEAEANEVAKLMKYAGAAMHINYGVGGSSQQDPFILWYMHRVADYGQYASMAQAWQYPLRDWSEKLYRQLAAKRPVAYASGGGGHIFLLDGYAGEGYFHFNWGWGGSQDGNFLLTALLPDQKMHFYQFAFFDICPSWMQPLNEEPKLFGSVKLDTTAMEPQIQVELVSRNPSPMSGQLCFVIAFSVDSGIVSDPVDFTLEADKQYSDPIALPFPEYEEIEPGVYPLGLFQRMSSGWEKVKADAYLEFDLYFVKRPENTYIGYLPYYTDMKLDETVKSLYQGCADTLSLKVTNYGTGMASLNFMPLLFNETDTFQLTTSNHLLVDGRNDLQLPIVVSDEIPVADYRLTVINGLDDSSDTISVSVAPGVKLVITEAPTIADTLFTNENNVFVFKVKNVGVRDFSGTLSTGVASEAQEQLYLRGQSLRIAVGEEQTYSGGIQTTLCEVLTITLQQDKAWPLSLASGELFEKNIVFIDKPTANEVIAAGGMHIAWQGQTLCVESAAPLQAYHIYNIIGNVMATGLASDNTLHIDSSAWPTGIYIVAIETADGKTMIQKTRK